MPNYAYLSLWFEDGAAEKLIPQAENLLRLFPVSPTEPGFRAFIIRAVGPAEAAVLERDALPAAEDVQRLLDEFFQADCAAELRAYWDLWTYRLSATRLEWREASSPVEVVFHGEEYDEGVFADNGHCLITLGLEHLFTGHAGILSGSGAEINPEQFAVRAEYEFALALQEAAALTEYRNRTLENIRRLLAFERALWKALPLRHRRLWSEGEANLEDRLERILLHRPAE